MGGGVVCPKPIASNVTSVGRGAAVSEFVNGDVLLCGGKLKTKSHLKNFVRSIFRKIS